MPRVNLEQQQFMAMQKSPLSYPQNSNSLFDKASTQSDLH